MDLPQNAFAFLLPGDLLSSPASLDKLALRSVDVDDLVRLNGFNFDGMPRISHPGCPIGILDVIKAGFKRIPAWESWQAPVESIFGLAPGRYFVLAHQLGMWLTVSYMLRRTAGLSGDGQEEPDLFDNLV